MTIVKNDDVDANIVCDETDVNMRDALFKRLETNHKMQNQKERRMVSKNVRGSGL